jgi:hypothetical protein
MKARSKQTILATAAILLSSVLLRAGEQVEFRGSTSVELPKPKRPMDDNRRIGRVDADRPSVDGGGIAIPIDASPLSNKKLREEMDKKKNWIFMNPYEQNFDSKTEEFMKGEKGTGLYDNRLMESSEEKTAVQKFMEEGRSKEPTRGDRDEAPSERSLPEREGALSKDADERDTDRRDLVLGEPKGNLDKNIFQSGALPDNFKVGPLDKSFERTLTDNPFAARKSIPTAMEKDELKQQQIAHEREFDKILTTRLGTGNNSVGRLGGLNVGGGLGQLNLNQPASRTGTLNLGRPGATAPNTVTFSDGGSSFGSRPGIDNRNFADTISLQPKAAPAFAPSVSQTPANQRPSFNPAPFSLPFPQRKF